MRCVKKPCNDYSSITLKGHQCVLTSPQLAPAECASGGLGDICIQRHAEPMNLQVVRQDAPHLAYHVCMDMHGWQILKVVHRSLGGYANVTAVAATDSSPYESREGDDYRSQSSSHWWLLPAPEPSRQSADRLWFLRVQHNA